MPTPSEILKKYWGYDQFRPIQKEVISSILSGRDTLAIMPTGAGKSICYQVPALMKEGLCLVISPLIALMKDQVSRLQENGIMAAYLAAGMNYHEVRQVLENMLHGPYKLLYISPERLQTELFQEYLPVLNLSMIAVDEAHCISQWGHDFRPNYLKIAKIKEALRNVPTIALTATATDDVRTDIVKQLKLKEANQYISSFHRDNIYYDIRYSENKNQHLKDALLEHHNGSSIIYCRSRRQTEALVKYLQQHNLSAVAYHAGMGKDSRDNAQQIWMSNTVPTMVATAAFGMGIDKADVRLVVHYDVPEHIEGYYQESGRAGRDGKPSTALCLYNHSDIKRLEDSTNLKFPKELFLRKVYQAVVEYLQVPIGTEPDRYFDFDLSDFCKKFKLSAVPTSNALKLLEQEGLWTLTEAVFSPATIHFIVDRTVLDKLGRSYQDLEYVCTGLLRLYGTVFHYPTPVRLAVIARQLKMKQSIVDDLLMKLDEMQIIEYNKPNKGPQLLFHHYRVHSDHLLINTKRINVLKQRHELLTKSILYFITNEKECRSKMLSRYFGEMLPADCLHCDYCSAHHRDTEVNEKDIRALLLKAISEHPSSTLHNIHLHLPNAIRVQATALLRQMLDEGVISTQPDGRIIKK